MNRLLALGLVALAAAASGCTLSTALGLACTEQYQCPGSLTCDQTGHCVESCPGNQIPCNGFCIDTSSDINNCGGCGKVCPGQACDYWASMNMGFMSETDCVNWVASVCMAGDAGYAECLAAGNPADAGICSMGVCTQTVDGAGANCGGIGSSYDCPLPTTELCAEDGGCPIDDCGVTGTLFCFGSQCNPGNTVCSCACGD